MVGSLHDEYEYEYDVAPLCNECGNELKPWEEGQENGLCEVCLAELEARRHNNDILSHYAAQGDGPAVTQVRARLICLCGQPAVRVIILQQSVTGQAVAMPRCPDHPPEDIWLDMMGQRPECIAAVVKLVPVA